jgi:hypothetical protein
LVFNDKNRSWTNKNVTMNDFLYPMK